MGPILTKTDFENLKNTSFVVELHLYRPQTEQEMLDYIWDQFQMPYKEHKTWDNMSVWLRDLSWLPCPDRCNVVTVLVIGPHHTTTYAQKVFAILQEARSCSADASQKERNECHRRLQVITDYHPRCP